MTTTAVKLPPHSKESEMMVLGSMLNQAHALNVGADGLEEGDFYVAEHRSIFHVLKLSWKTDKPADIYLIAEELKRLNKLKEVGGIEYLTGLAQYAGSSSHIEEYVRVVKSKALLRQMIEAAREVERKALEDPSDVPDVLDAVQQRFFAISQAANTRCGVTVRDLLGDTPGSSEIPYLKDLQKRQERFKQVGGQESEVTGLPTRFLDLDKMIDGLNPSNLMILAGRPGMGKTAFMLNVAENVCFRNGTAVGIFSLEMTAEQLLHRVICSQAEVESEKIKRGSLSGVEFQKIVQAVNGMMHSTMIIDDQPGLKITDLRARARRMKEVYNIGLVVIDYLQLLSGSGTLRSSMESRQYEITEISRMLKILARELDVPIICGSQLSRKVEERQDHRPLMSDLRESGSIEQDSDLVMFLLRREYYDPYDKPGLAELIVSKNRHGPTGHAHLTYRKEFAKFDNYTPTEKTPSSGTQADPFSSFKSP